MVEWKSPTPVAWLSTSVAACPLTVTPVTGTSEPIRIARQSTPDATVMLMLVVVVVVALVVPCVIAIRRYRGRNDTPTAAHVSELLLHDMVVAPSKAISVEPCPFGSP